MTRRSLTARWVMPIDGPPLPGGVVTLEEGLIVSVGDRRSAARSLEDLGDVVVLPGLVNAHTHLEFSDLRRPLGRPGMELADWIRLVIADRKRTDRDRRASIAAGLRESLACGVTTIAEIATSPFDAGDAEPQVLAFQEVIGFSAARIDSALAELCDRLEPSRESTTRRPPTYNVPTTGISPHAPYTVHPRLLARLVDEAVRHDLPLAMHLAESRTELELLAEGTGPLRRLLEERSMWDAAAISPGTAPLDYLRALSRAPRTLVVHGNYLAPAEIEFLGDHRERMSVVYCPRTHQYFRHSEYPLPAMLRSGVRVVLGTDSRASNPDLNLMDEIRAVVERHGLPPEDAIRLGTLASAEALGLADVLGSITPGKRGDLIAVPCANDHPSQAVLTHSGAPTRVWLGGELVF